jgi:hypothetical protein
VLHLDCPWLPNNDGWVFLGASIEHGDLRQIRRRLAVAVGTLITPSGRGGPDTRDHLTLGLCDGAPPSGYDQLFIPETTSIDSVGVGHVGTNGTVLDTVLDTVASFELCGA